MAHLFIVPYEDNTSHITYNLMFKAFMVIECEQSL